GGGFLGGLLGLLGSLGALLRLLARQVLLGMARDAARRHQVVGGKEARHAVARQRADRQPVLGALDVQHQALGMVLRHHRVVVADVLDEAAVARAARVGDDDAVVGALLGAAAGQADLQGHGLLLAFFLQKFGSGVCQWKGLPPPMRPPRPPRSIPFFPIFCTRFMMRVASLCCFSSLFKSCTEVPEPAAMRCLRDALIRSGFLRSFGVIEDSMASWRFTTPSSSLAFLICCIWAVFMPGSMPMRLESPPIFCICCSCLAKSSRSKLPFCSFLASFSASSASMDSAAFSTSHTTSPMPRMREAMRSGWKPSSASSFSPTPMSLIGQPVTARMESAAPPRASPSTRVSTMPVRPTRSLKAVATLTASWPVIASATSRLSCGLAASRTAATSAISASSIARRPAVSSSTTS